MYYGISPILIIAAVVPAIFLVGMVYKLDKKEKESPRLMGRLLLLGALSTAIAIVLEQIGLLILDSIYPEVTFTYLVIENFIVIGLSEEWSKYIVLKKSTWNNPEFNCMFDGVVYAVTVSLGFALWENIKYVSILGFGTALIRAVTAIPGHASFGVFMGIFYGMAKRAENRKRMAQSNNCKRVCILIPAFVHGAYDLLATIDKNQMIFLPFIIFTFILAYRMIKKWQMNDEYIDIKSSNNTNIKSNTVYNAPRKDNDYTYRK